MNLDELEARALAAKEARDDWPWVGMLVAVYGHRREAAAHIAACDPDTILHLIERARAGEALMVYAMHRLRCETASGSCTCGFLKTKARWESLAHTPQEAG